MNKYRIAQQQTETAEWLAAEDMGVLPVSSRFIQVRHVVFMRIEEEQEWVGGSLVPNGLFGICAILSDGEKLWVGKRADVQKHGGIAMYSSREAAQAALWELIASIGGVA